MDLREYERLRAKIKTQSSDFETRNKSWKNILWIVSFIGNLGSIFFAYFLIYPAFNKTISAHITSSSSGIISGIITVMILAIFELVKRKLIRPLSFNLVKNNWKINNGIIGEFVLAISIITISFYFSLHGAKNFSITSSIVNNEIKSKTDSLVDSLSKKNEALKQFYITDNQKLMASNASLREKLTNTDEKSGKIRKDYQSIIDSNVKQISDNDSKIKSIDNDLKQQIVEIKKNESIQVDENKSNDVGFIILFILISTCIELIIVIGIYYHEFYDCKVFYTNEKLEKTVLKKNRYITLLKYVYKNGDAKIGEKVVGVSVLKDLLKEKTQIPNPNKFADEFYREMDSFGIFKIEGKRRYLNVSYESAIEKISSLEEDMDILSTLN